MSSASALRELAAAFPDRTPEALARVLESHGGSGDLAAATLLAEAIAGEAGDDGEEDVLEDVVVPDASLRAPLEALVMDSPRGDDSPTPRRAASPPPAPPEVNDAPLVDATPGEVVGAWFRKLWSTIVVDERGNGAVANGAETRSTPAPSGHGAHLLPRGGAETDITSPSLSSEGPDAGESTASGPSVEARRLWGNPDRFVSRDDCAAALRSLPEASAALAACDAAIASFNESARPGPSGRGGRADDSQSPSKSLHVEAWRARAAEAAERFLDALLACGGRFDSCVENARHREALQNVVDGYVSGGIQGPVLARIRRMFEAEDAAFEARLRRVAKLPPEALGMHGSRLDAMDAHAVGTLRSVSGLSCPRHMATAVCDVTRHLAQNCARIREWAEARRREEETKRKKATRSREEEEETRARTQTGGGARGERPVEGAVSSAPEDARSEGMLAGSSDNGARVGDGGAASAPRASDAIPGTDDLLSLLVLLVAKARPRHAVSLAEYVDGFHTLVGGGHEGELGFALANFLGAIQYIRSDAMLEVLEEWKVEE